MVHTHTHTCIIVYMYSMYQMFYFFSHVHVRTLIYLMFFIFFQKVLTELDSGICYHVLMSLNEKTFFEEFFHVRLANTHLLL